MFYWQKNCFRLVWMLNFFNPHQTGLKSVVEKALIAATCGISYTICTAHLTLLVNKKDTVSTRHVYLVDLRQEGYTVVW